MFTDYYSILDIPHTATFEDIKKAYRKQALIWHPDKNPGKDTVKRMQEINEAYLILSDVEARAKYDAEYLLFTAKVGQQRNTSDDSSFSYQMKDDILKNWMENAKRQAQDMMHLSLDDMLGITKAAAKGAFSGALFYGIGVLFFVILFTALISSGEAGRSAVGIIVLLLILSILFSVCYVVYKIIVNIAKKTHQFFK